mmetsp:Transcript_29502/g.100298  ORF Transcript_29502/g.100298 Transcript_29502/m.100298 type:complete len:217 (-) Transcript_29502:397-1047(-)
MTTNLCRSGGGRHAPGGGGRVSSRRSTRYMVSVSARCAVAAVSAVALRRGPARFSPLGPTSLTLARSTASVFFCSAALKSASVGLRTVPASSARTRFSSHDSVFTRTRWSKPTKDPGSVPSGTTTCVGASFLAPVSCKPTTHAPSCRSRSRTFSAAPPGCWPLGRGSPRRRFGGGGPPVRKSLKSSSRPLTAKTAPTSRSASSSSDGPTDGAGADA